MRVIDVLSTPWAIIPERLKEITGIYSTHLKGEKIDIDSLEARLGQPLARKEQGYDVVDGVAIVPMDGVISKKMNLFSRISGGASTQLIERDFLEAMADPEVHSIILHADTPGGSVDGTAELAKVIYDSRGDKPIYALADGLMASAGVWIGSAADKIFVTSETTLVGSIGVVTQHVDYSEQYKNQGVSVTEIYAGKYKRIAGSYKPLSEEGKAHIQSEVDYLYSIFVDTIAKHRGTSADDVLENMADGKLFIGQQAIDVGLVDGVSTLNQLIEELSSNAQQPKTFAGSAKHATQPKEKLAEIQSKLSELSGDDKDGSNHEVFKMNLEELKEKHPETAKAAKDEGYEQGLKAGVEAESKRIKSVKAQTMPGHEALIESFMFDGKTTGEQAAVAVLNAEREKRATATAKRVSDAAELRLVSPSDDSEQAEATTTKSDTLEAKWEKSASLRAEFNNNFDSYVAYEKANAKGQVKILGGK